MLPEYTFSGLAGLLLTGACQFAEKVSCEFQVTVFLLLFEFAAIRLSEP